MTTPEFELKCQQHRLALSAILAEFDKAEAKHPEWPDDVIHAAAIVGEEVGELTRACVQYEYENGDLHNCQTEAIQIGAVTLRFLEGLPGYR